MSFDGSNRRKSKPNVSKACVNCRKAHLACNDERPCKRCVSLSKQDTCFDVDHKKRGRPKAQPNKPKPPKQTSYSSLPIIHPYSTQSSFKMTDNSHTATPVQNTSIATILLTMDLSCARLSDEINDILGYYPQEIAHRSLYSFVTSDSNESLSRIHRHLLDNVVYTAQKVDPHYRYIHTPPTDHSASERFFDQNPQVLCSIANGSQSFTSLLYLKRSDGNVECLQSQFCLGGGLGADLLNPSTLGSLYIICLLSKMPDAPLSTPSPSALSVSSMTENQSIPVSLVPANQWDIPYSESPPPLPPQPVQYNQHQPQPQSQDSPQQQFQNLTQSHHAHQRQPSQQQIPQHYHQQLPPNPSSQQPQSNQTNFGIMNATIPFMEHRSSMQSDSEGYSFVRNVQIERDSVTNRAFTDTSMTNSAIKEESSALSCPSPTSHTNNNSSNTNNNNTSFKKNNDMRKKAEFFQKDSVVHAAPISNSQRMFSKEKRPLFDNQTSTLFRALNEISIKDNNKTSFMNVQALLT